MESLEHLRDALLAMNRERFDLLTRACVGRLESLGVRVTDKLQEKIYDALEEELR